MTPERQRLVEEIFLSALEVKPDQRPALLNDRCGSDLSLRDEVLGLLKCHDGPPGVLDQPAPVGQSLLMGLRSLTETEPVTIPPGGRIGHYRITGVLGAGGMGAVYIGEQDRPRRTVALKVIRPGYASRQLLRRMEHEADLLGRLQHPGIAQIYEAGTADYGNGPQPFFAMELVSGPPINKHSDERSLSTADRLRLMLQVCAAVEHAHQRGVIHRDLKPGNILVDTSGQAKVLDFGVARATDSDLYATTLQTSVGQLVGTLPYMSPEQVSGKPDQIDTRTDVYALGVVMYELLTGKLPHDLANRSIPEAARVIRDEAPRKLSTINRHLRGDVETIINKAMEKDKARRYQSAAALAEDIRRYLAGEPIVAKRDSAFYVLGKQIRRHRVASLLAFSLLAGLVFFALYAWHQALEYRNLADSETLAKQAEKSARESAEVQRREADEQRQRVGELNTQLTERLDASIIERGRLEALAGNGAVAESMLWPQLARNPSSTQAWWALWELYSRFPSRWMVSVQPGLLSMDVSPSKKIAAAIGRRGELVLCSTDDGSVITTSEAYTVNSRVVQGYAVVFTSPTTIASSYGDGTVLLWEVAGKRLVRAGSIKASERGITQLAVAPSGRTLATSGTDLQTRLWNLDTGAMIAQWNAHPLPLLAMCFSPDGATLATAAADQTFALWKTTDGTLIRRSEAVGQALTVLCFSPDSSQIALTGQARVVDIFRTADLKHITSHKLSKGDPRTMFYAPDASQLFVGSTMSLRVIDLQSPANSVDRGFGYARILRIAPGANPGEVVSLQDDGSLRLWSTALSHISLATPHSSWVFALDVSPDARRVMTSSADGRVLLLDHAGADRIASFTLPAIPGRAPTRSRACAFSPDATLAAAGFADGSVHLLNPVNLEQIATLSVERAGEVYGLAFSPDSSTLASVHFDRRIRLWNLKTRKLITELTGFDGYPRSAAFSPDGKSLYAGGSRKGIIIYDTASWERTGLLETSAEPWAVTVSPDGSMIAAGTFSAYVEIFDAKTQKRRGGQSGHQIVVAGLAFTRDSSLLISGGDDGGVRVWDPTTGTLLLGFDLGKGEVPCAASSPDGRTIFAGCQSGVLARLNLRAYDASIAANAELAIRRHIPALEADPIVRRLQEDAERPTLRLRQKDPNLEVEPEAQVSAAPKQNPAPTSVWPGLRSE